MINQVQFACLWCCVLTKFVVWVSNFTNLVLFSVVIHKTKGKKLISKTIRYKLDSTSKIQFVFFCPKVIQKHFWKTIDFVKNLEMTQIAAGRGRVIFLASLWRNACENWYVIHHLLGAIVSLTFHLLCNSRLHKEAVTTIDLQIKLSATHRDSEILKGHFNIWV